MKCELCDKEVSDKPPADYRVYWHVGLEDELETQEWKNLYRHVSTWECPSRSSRCIVCGMEFNHSKRPWADYVLHLKKYGHLAPEDHAVCALMEQES